MTDLLEAPERPETLPPFADRGPRFAAHVLDGVIMMVLIVAAVLGVSLARKDRRSLHDFGSGTTVRTRRAG